MDAAHTGRSGYLLPRSPRVLGRQRATARISSQLVVALDGSLVFGSHDGLVYAVSPARDAIAWRFSTGDRVYPTPLVHPDGRVYVGSDSDRFYSLTPRGRLGVGLATDDDADTSAVVVPDGTMRFAAGRALYSVDPELTVRWRLDFGGKVFSSPAASSDGTVFVGCQDNGVYSVNAEGGVRWRSSTGGDVDASPVIDEARGRVYVGSDDGAVRAFATGDGAEIWTAHVGGYVRAPVALGLDGTLVVGTYGPRTRVVALDSNDGTLRWSIAIPGPPTEDYGIASAALVDGDGRYALGTPDDAVLFVDPDGTVAARVALPADVDSSPVLVADRLLAVGCDDGGMYWLGE